MKELRFSVFGKSVALTRRGPRWEAHVLGSDGKRRPAEFVVPDFIEEDELCEYLFDLFHENATGSNGGVEPVD